MLSIQEIFLMQLATDYCEATVGQCWNCTTAFGIKRIDVFYSRNFLVATGVGQVKTLHLDDNEISTAFGMNPLVLPTCFVWKLNEAKFYYGFSLTVWLPCARGSYKNCWPNILLQYFQQWCWHYLFDLWLRGN